MEKSIIKKKNVRYEFWCESITWITINQSGQGGTDRLGSMWSHATFCPLKGISVYFFIVRFSFIGFVYIFVAKIIIYGLILNINKNNKKNLLQLESLVVKFVDSYKVESATFQFDIWFVNPFFGKGWDSTKRIYPHNATKIYII